MKRTKITKKAFGAYLTRKYGGKVEYAKRTEVDEDHQVSAVLYLYYHTEYGHCGTWTNGSAVEFDCEAHHAQEQKIKEAAK